MPETPVLPPLPEFPITSSPGGPASEAAAESHPRTPRRNRDTALRAVRGLPRWARRTGLGLLITTLVFVVGTGIGIGIATHNYTAAEELWLKVEEAEASEGRLEAQVERLEKENSGLSSQIDGVSDREMAAGVRDDELDARETAQDERDTTLADREKAVGVAEAAAKANSFDNGTHLVGTDIQPGTYRSSGSDGCYWSRLRNLSGELGSIIANGISEGQVVVTIASGDKAFESSRCGTWTKVG